MKDAIILHMMGDNKEPIFVDPLDIESVMQPQGKGTRVRTKSADTLWVDEPVEEVLESIASIGVNKKADTKKAPPKK